MSLVALDLSPFYLAEARKNMLHWAELRAPGQALGGGLNRTGASFMQANAENLPEADASFDVVCQFIAIDQPCGKMHSRNIMQV